MRLHGTLVWRMVCVGVVMAGGAGIAAHGQLPSPPPPTSSGMPSHFPSTSQPSGDPSENAARAIQEAQRTRAVANERQKKLQQDTEKLLALATELRDELAKTNKNELSLDVVRKAEEIEKLARDVKMRMRS